MDEPNPAVSPPTSQIEQPPTEEKILVTGAHGSEALKVGDVGIQQRPRRSPLRAFLDIFLPNRAVSPAVMGAIIAVEVGLFLLVWLNSPFKILPRPYEVLSSLGSLWMTRGLGQELATSFKLNLEALGWASLLSLGLSYLTVIPVFRPIVGAISKGRFLSLAGISLLFILVFEGGHQVKTALLVFAVTVFYLTSMASVIANIPKSDFDHARTLRMSEWRVVWEVVILGTADKAFEVLRQNAAMGWMMLTAIETLSRSEGGIGVMLMDVRKHFLLPEVFAIQLVILLAGLLQDYVLGALRRFVCPYADISLERQ